MRNHKKIFSLLLVSVMIFTMFTACGGATGGNGTSGNWEMDKDNHWHISENGEKTDVAAHSLEENICSVCGVEIVEFDTGEIWVQKYNDHGDDILWIIYDEDGNMTQNTKNEYTYDEDGNWATKKEYHDGTLYQEIVFKTVSTEEEISTYQELSTTYDEDGTKLIEEYNENGDVIKETMYTVDGTVEYEYTVTTEYNENDLMSSIKKYAGDTVVVEIRYEYDADGNPVAKKIYSEGTLVKEDIYTNLDGYAYVSKTIVYNEDGTQTVTEYDEYGEEIK